MKDRSHISDEDRRPLTDEEAHAMIREADRTKTSRWLDLPTKTWRNMLAAFCEPRGGAGGVSAGAPAGALHSGGYTVIGIDADGGEICRPDGGPDDGSEDYNAGSPENGDPVKLDARAERHRSDDDCARSGGLDASGDTCTICGVAHGDPCACGGRGYHRPGCPEAES